MRDFNFKTLMKTTNFTFKAEVLKVPAKQSDMIHRIQDGVL